MTELILPPKTDSSRMRGFSFSGELFYSKCHVALPAAGLKRRRRLRRGIPPKD